MNYDIIGDIHGHADQLRQLLEKLGYIKTDNGYTPPSGRKAIFVGDFIDRGPKIRETLEIVKSMCDRENALAVLGNHEYNALCFHTPDDNQKGEWLRDHSCKNVKQHVKTLQEFKNRPQEWQNYRDWFMSLPLFLDLGEIRIVHAAWIPSDINKIAIWTSENRSLNERLLQKSASEGFDEFNTIERVLKGVEIPLPKNAGPFKDKDGHPRKDIRIQWWNSAVNKTYEEMLFPQNDSTSFGGKIIEPSKVEPLPVYKDNVPVFFGHYWLTGSTPVIQTNNICCLDYSVAMGGRLVAYRWDGEKTLRNDHFVSVQ